MRWVKHIECMGNEKCAQSWPENSRQQTIWEILDKDEMTVLKWILGI